MGCGSVSGSRMMSAARSAIMIVGAFDVPARDHGHDGCVDDA